MPTMRTFLKKGTSATGNGLLTQAPPNTGAGWYTLATGAWPGVHGSTNNTFHINGQPFAQPHRGVRPERPPGRVDRPVGRARRPQGRPGRVGRRAQRDHPGPDHRLPVVLLGPRRRDELHRQRRASRCSTTPPFIAAFGLQFDHPAGYAGQAPFPAPRRRPRPAGPARCRRPYSPAKEMRLRVLDFGVDKYGLNAYIFDSTNDGTTNYDKVLFSRTKSGRRRRRHPREGRVGRRQGEDRRRRARQARPPACSSRSRS